MGRIVHQGLRAREFEVAGLADLEQRAGRRGDVCLSGTGAKVGEEDRKVLSGRATETFAEVGVVHLVLDDAERDPRFTAHDEGLADGIAKYPLRTGAAARGPGLHEGQGADAGNDRRGPSGDRILAI